MEVPLKLACLQSMRVSFCLIVHPPISISTFSFFRAKEKILFFHFIFKKRSNPEIISIHGLLLFSTVHLLAFHSAHSPPSAEPHSVHTALLKAGFQRPQARSKKGSTVLLARLYRRSAAISFTPKHPAQCKSRRYFRVKTPPTASSQSGAPLICFISYSSDHGWKCWSRRRHAR